jgi:hypothetical protein
VKSISNELGIFVITYFLGHFRPCNFEKMELISMGTCGQNFICLFTTLSEICPLKFRVLECS